MQPKHFGLGLNLFAKPHLGSVSFNSCPLMTEAAKLGVAPNTIMINSDHNFFVTEFVQNQLIEHLHGQKKVPFEFQAQIYCLCARLDAAGVFHFYGNPTSIRISNSNRLYITAYEYSKPLEHADKNMKTTLWKLSANLVFFQTHVYSISCRTCKWSKV